MSTLNERIKELKPARRKRIESRAAALIAEEMSLRDLRQALKLTQERIAEALDIGQDGVSRLEQGSDLLISTLRSCIEAMGGHLELVVEFPNRPPVVLSGFGSVKPEAPARRGRHGRSKES
jgi:DNA-binding XRE family transcriptional regulator